AVAAQHDDHQTAAQRAESLRLAGRPWHAAETLLAAAARELHLEPAFVLAGAKAELRARRYDRARGLLAGQPWLGEYADGAGLAVLAEAEARLGRASEAAGHYAAARAHAPGARGALLAVRAALAWEAGGEKDSAAAAYGAARTAGLAVIDSWLRVRQARVTRDTAVAFRLLADLPPPAAREVPAARAQALLVAGDSAAALEAFAQAGRARVVAREAGLGPLAIYRRARILVRLGDPGAREALSGFAQSYPADTAAPTALYVLGDMLADRGDWVGAAQWFAELVARYPADLRASLARFRLAAQATQEGLLDSAAALYQAEVAAAAPQRTAARFWLGKLALSRGDTADAEAAWVALAHEDSIGYYGLRARREVALPPLRLAAPP